MALQPGVVATGAPTAMTERDGRRGEARGNCRYAFPASTAPTNQSPTPPRLSSTVRPVAPGHIIVPAVEAPQKDPAMSQRLSDPQLLAVQLDEVLPRVIRKLDADGVRDEEDAQIIATLTAVNTGQLRHAEIYDFTTSVSRIGMTKRNRQRARELFPEFDGAA